MLVDEPAEAQGGKLLLRRSVGLSALGSELRCLEAGPREDPRRAHDTYNKNPERGPSKTRGQLAPTKRIKMAQLPVLLGTLGLIYVNFFRSFIYKQNSGIDPDVRPFASSLAQRLNEKFLRLLWTCIIVDNLRDALLGDSHVGEGHHHHQAEPVVLLRLLGSNFWRLSACFLLLIVFFLMNVARSTLETTLSWREGAGSVSYWKALELEPVLVREGLYGICRHPYYFLCTVYALLLWTLRPHSVGGGVLVALLSLVLYQQALFEEDVLLGVYGAQYRAYAMRVGRYLPGRDLIIPILPVSSSQEDASYHEPHATAAAVEDKSD